MKFSNNSLIDVSNRVYYLDLLRALAIMLVFTAHTAKSFDGPEVFNTLLGFGGTGVDLFFLLSGWLIGSQLFREQEKFGNIELKRFWYRRWMRTLPAYFTVLLFTLCQLYLTKESVPSPLPYFLFLQNYFHLSYFTVSWSLALEEQFYLFIAPFILLVVKISSVKTQSFVLFTILVLPSVFRFFELFSTGLETHVRLDCCIMGVYLAFIYRRQRAFWDRIARYATPICICSILLYVSFFVFRAFPPFENYVDPSKLMLAIIFAGLLLKAAISPVESLPFFHNIIMHISTRSYSIYLLHPDALAVCKRIIDSDSLLVYYSAALAISLIASEFLYRIVEVTFINYREKFDKTKKRRAAL
ncbi:acyltransferase [Alteromonas sp. W364]|uniref:acyltransferase family protein n=1 Tax=Alteromonas sp. W364 TaxID=3075610 RepID=UPI002884AD68|nr:acyltransferase [Alteromonas sp. W364]MDT0627684.1 acyltransferase [Alteromonas sp. W364]